MKPAEQLQQTVKLSMTVAGVSPDATPGRRLGEPERVAAESQLRGMLRSLRPLPLGGADQTLSAELVVTGRLGEGGMGLVELAYQRTLEREVAVKRLHDPSEGGFMLLDEARINGSLEHPNIVPVHAVGLDQELGPLVVLKRVQGVSWKEELAKDRDKLPSDAQLLEKHLRILMQVCNALHYAHSHKVVHRDVKPENVMLGEYGEVYLLDWGIALRMDQLHDGVSSVAGTALYMAPEMVRGELDEIEPRTDVYLLGATLHELLTGKARNYALNVAGCMIKALTSAPAEYDDDVPAELGSIANRACALEVDMRFPSARAFRDALEDFLDHREARHLLETSRELLDKSTDLEGTAGWEMRSQWLFQARFAAEQALKLLPGYAEARAARRDCLLTMIQHELDSDNLRGARVLVRELGGKDQLPPALQEELEEKQAAHLVEREQLRVLERDQDETANLKLRLGFLIVTAVVLTAANIWALLFSPRGPLEPVTWRLPVVGLTTSVFGGFVALHLREKLEDRAIDLQFVRTFAGGALLIGGASFIGWYGKVATANLLAVMLLLFASMLGLPRLPLKPAVPIAAVIAACGIVCVVVPNWAPALYTVIFSGLMFVVIIDHVVKARKEGVL